MGWLLAASAFLGAALAFIVEPMVARLLLPTYGGSAAVWTTALVFFQSVLVAGYAWAHVSLARLGIRRHAVLQSALAIGTLVVLPVSLPGWARPPADVPVGLWLVVSLVAIVGLPFFVLSSNGPTVQRWFATAGGGGGAEPYRLFAASNAGSLVGLLAYPTLVGPGLDLPDQTRWWAAGFAVFAALTVIAAWLVRRAASREPAAVPLGRPAGEPSVTTRRRLRWIVLAAVPAAVLVGVTSHLSIDVAAVPFLWVVPLAIYLVTLILAYARARPILAGPARLALVPLAIVAALSLADAFQAPIALEFGIHLATLLAAGLALHGALADDRPPPADLTDYTLLVAAGGALGGLAAGIAAPAILPVPLEEHLALVAALLVAPLLSPARRRSGLVALAAPLAVAAILAVGIVTAAPAVSTSRSFYGTYRVVDDGQGRHVLYAGTTIHGIQDRTPGREREPWSYYARSGPLGQVLTTLIADPRPLRIAAVGLGTGAIAAYGRPGDSVEFLEIDPAVVAIARDPALFTYVADSAADVQVAIGDGRLLLEAAEPGSYHLVVLDAFSSDAVPVHLLTVEGLDAAMSRTRPDGVVAVHISNRYLDLEPVVAAAARELGFVAILGETLTAAEEVGRAQASQWVVVGRSYTDVAGLVAGSAWRTAHASGHAAWTDRWSDVVAVLRRR